MEATIYYDTDKKVSFSGTAKSLQRFLREVKRVYEVNRIKLKNTSLT